MLYTHYLISTDNRSPYRELGSNVPDAALSAFVESHYSHFCENEELDKEQFSIYTTKKEMTVGCVNQLYLREKNRYFYLSHIYCVDLAEREQLLPLLPNIISTAEFEHIPRQDPDLTATRIPCRSDDSVTITYPKDVLKQLVQACIDKLLNGGNLFIVSGWDDCFNIKSRDLMSQIVFLLPYQCRRKLNFCSYANDISASAETSNIVFCRPQDALEFQRLYGTDSTFYFLQQKLSFPQIEVRPFADFAVEHTGEIGEMLTYADRKLTGKLKNDPEFYDVLCHFKYVEKDETISNYAKHRAWLIPNLSQLYQLGIASRKKALQLLENELHFEPDDSDVPFETKLSAFLYCYETEMVSKELMHEFLLHIRSCTDPIKWQLLCRQLDIPMEEELMTTPAENTEQPFPTDQPESPTGEIDPEAANTDDPAKPEFNATDIPTAEEIEDENMETVEILSQPDNFDVPDEDAFPADTPAQSASVPDENMPFLSINLPSSEPKQPEEEENISAEAGQQAELDSAEQTVSPEKPTMLPKAILEPFIANLMTSSNIIKYINAGCLHYNKPLYQEFYVQRAVAQYLSGAISCCESIEELNKVRTIADQIRSYQEEAMVIISEEVHRLTDERELVLIQMEKEHKLALQKQREQEMLSQFDGIFRSGNIGELERISLIPRCVAAHISKEIIEEYALQEYRETKNALALLFLCCQYNVNGELEDCQPERIEQYLHANIRAKELKYEWLENLASLPNLSRHPQFNAALVQFVKSDEESQNEAKLNRDSLYYWMVENEILQSAARRYFILGGVIVGAITAVTAAGILLAKFGLLG